MQFLYQPWFHGCPSNTIPRLKLFCFEKTWHCSLCNNALAVYPTSHHPAQWLILCSRGVRLLSNFKILYLYFHIPHAGHGRRVGAIPTNLRRHYAELHHEPSLQEEAQEARGIIPLVTKQTWQTETVDQEEIIEEEKSLIGTILLGLKQWNNSCTLILC